jgi:hypothetical protein
MKSIKQIKENKYPIVENQSIELPFSKWFNSDLLAITLSPRFSHVLE